MKGRTPLFRQAQRVLAAAHQANLEAAGNSRRDFIRIAGATSLGILAAPWQGLGQDAPTPPEPPKEAAKEAAPAAVDLGPVAIVGGGIAGLTAAYRLQQKGVQVELFEAATRLGGRMWTKKDFNKDKMFVELGGELVDTPHVELIELAKELGVEIQGLKEGEKALEYYHFGGKVYTDKELIPAFQPLAKRIAEAAEGLTDDKDEYTEKAIKLDKTPLSEWLKANSEGVEKWVIQMLDIAYTCEYGLEISEQSALNLIDFINPDTSNGFEIFGESDEAYRIKGGNQTLPDAVAKALEGKIKVHMEHSLTGISDDGKKFSLSFLAESKKKSVQFAKVILAIPFTILREVKGWKDLAISDEKKEVIQKMAYGTNVKLMLGFTEKVWRTLTPPANGAAYSDLPFQTCWETSRGQEGNGGILTNFMGGKTGDQFGPDRIKKVVSELDKVFPGVLGKQEKDDKGVAVMANLNWPKIKFIKASYSLTGVGQYCTYYEIASEPELDGRLIFAGEHTSVVSPGYMDGGVNSGNRAARQFLGEPEPEEEEPGAPPAGTEPPPPPGEAPPAPVEPPPAAAPSAPPAEALPPAPVAPEPAVK